MTSAFLEYANHTTRGSGVSVPGRLGWCWLLGLLIISPAQAELMEGRVVRIVDGDTLVFLDQSNTQHRVRLAGIDTPQRGQAFGRRATQNLARLTGNKAAQISSGPRWAATNA